MSHADPALRYYVATPGDSQLVHDSAEFREQFIRANQSLSADTDDGFPRRIVDQPDDSDIIVLFEAWSLKLTAYAHVLSHCSFLRKHAPRILVVNYDDAGTAFLPGCHTSLTPRTFDPLLHKATCYPRAYNRFVTSFAARSAEIRPQWLGSFRGATRNITVRRRIRQQLSGVPGFQISDPAIEFHHHDEASQVAYLEEVAGSEFVLCPRGEGPASYRMFEVMQMGRCPVIISDDWQPIEGIDWHSCSIRIRERDVGELPQLLAERRDDARSLGRNARSVWETFFEDRARFRLYAVQMAQLHATRAQHGALDFDALRRRWASRHFRWQRGWTLPQRLLRAPRRAATMLQYRSAPRLAATTATEATEQRT